ncbi:histidinol-phosphate transaminase [Oenococcus kitaharae]|uniref:Histidinol-phosphate aminotransferase n=1 Tax=Oenococcus kitaharae DSM 17330 TaxID=1045004 RepID=G9WHB9_9LACO|nr:histidinol-phosphate transaminase [Oenococcus kitaharae]EHN59764.1 Histidinol-phosphate aminotransferase [Oenococcus kitaharae DSM 17330]OEY83588.1 histidinol-phosphate aminotransferase [Oenococcus kitaharae]OEY85386.1 histidinol-phosphate aminotransferase [Oenococcus kitaharae]OEY86239.1 histidinol-phosphate aminotransferase [Oenococcus kitaharae]
MKKQIQSLENYTPPIALEQLKEKFGIDKLALLSANENPYGSSPKVKDAILHWQFEQSNRYPDGNASQLRAAVADKFSLDPKQLVFTAGLDEMILMFSRVFLEPGDEVLLTEPTFSEYALQAQIEGAKVVSIPCRTDNGAYDFPAFLKNINEKTKLIWICNPNNPTGSFETLADLTAFIKQVPKNILILIDEAYIDYVTKEAVASAIGLLSQFENLAVLRTFSKAYGLANFRVGYAAMSLQNAAYMQAVRLPYNLSSLSQLAALAAFKDQDFVAETVRKNQQERINWEHFLRGCQISFYASQANFIFFQYPQADKLAQTLLLAGFQIRQGLQKGWLRVTIGTRSDNQAIQNIIKKELAVNQPR